MSYIDGFDTMRILIERRALDYIEQVLDYGINGRSMSNSRKRGELRSPPGSSAFRDEGAFIPVQEGERGV
jgi:hypothetical protein